MYHLDSDHESQIKFEQAFNARYLEWVRNLIDQFEKIEQESTIRSGKPDVGRILGLPVFRRVFFSEPDQAGLPSIYVGYQAMWDKDYNVLVVRDSSELGKELRRIQIEKDESIRSSFSYPDYVGVRILHPNSLSDVIENIFCYGRCNFHQHSAPNPTVIRDSGSNVSSDTIEIELDYAEATRDAANAPKTGFSPLVGNLQQDQYEILDMPSSEPLFVQGPPGSGKTVIAMSRARDLAYINSEVIGQAQKKVLLLGPTDRYVSFVMPLHNRLSKGDRTRFEIKSIRELIVELAETRSELDDDFNLGGIGSSKEVAEIIDDFYRTQNWDVDLEYDNLSESARQQPGHQPRKTRPELFHNGLRDYAESLSEASEASTWISELPTYATSRRRSDAQVLIALSRTYTMSRDQYDYIIIDEAQDLPWGAWQIIKRLLVSPNHISAFGDFTQSKGISTAPSSWNELRGFFENSGATNLHVKKLIRSFRCTQAIMNYASHFSGVPQDFLKSLRKGAPVPQKNWGGFADSGEELIKEISRLALKVDPGVLAVCSFEKVPLEGFLAQVGFEMIDQNLGIWTKDNLRFHVLNIDDIASVEFDALIVVGLKQIKEELGPGVAFTLLTRPAKELSVFLYS